MDEQSNLTGNLTGNFGNTGKEDYAYKLSISLFKNIVNLSNESDNSPLGGYNIIKNSMNLNRNALITRECVFNLEMYFYAVLESNPEVYEKQFMLLYNRYSQIPEICYMAFWLPFINGQELLSRNIFQKYETIIFNETTLTSIDQVTYSSSLLNTYAFNIAITNSFSDSCICFILKQRKIKIPIEWLMEKILYKQVDILEAAFLGGNDCFITNREVSNKLRDVTQVRRDDSNTTLNASASINKTPVSRRGSFSNVDRLLSKNRNLSDTKLDKAVDLSKEFAKLIQKGTGKLTISKLIVLANVTISLKPNFTLDEVNNMIRTICLFDRVKECLLKFCKAYIS